MGPVEAGYCTRSRSRRTSATSTPETNPVFFERITTIALRVPGSALGFARSRASSDVEIALGEMGNPTLVEALNAPDLLAERQLARAALVQAF